LEELNIFQFIGSKTLVPISVEWHDNGRLNTFRVISPQPLLQKTRISAMSRVASTMLVSPTLRSFRRSRQW